MDKKLSLITCLEEGYVIPPDIPGCMNFWYGGNLDEYNDIISQKNGRYEYGPGLYMTTHYDTARKYSKGSRKMYLLTVNLGVDINDATLDVNLIYDFIKTYVISSKRKEILIRMEKYVHDGMMGAHILNNMLLNEKAIKSSNTKYLREFYVNNGIDYEIINNPFGWGEKMMVLYNMKRIVNVYIVKPTDKIIVFDLLEK